MGIETLGALFTRAPKYDRHDVTPELEKIQSRRRMRIGLEAADAFEHAVRERVVFVNFAATDDDCDPLDMTVQFNVIDEGGDDRLNPVFRFNLRDAFFNDVKDVDWTVARHYHVIADGLERFLTAMRAELALFSQAEVEDRARGFNPDDPDPDPAAS